jgi:acylphosphatase
MAEIVARSVRVSGRVQGVFFRDACRSEAESHQVAGWVSNEPDGSVQAWFEGSPEAVDAMLAWCRSGPPRADVSDVQVRDESPGGLTDFEVR